MANENYDAFCRLENIKLKLVKQNVIDLLTENPELRNDDNALVFAYLNKHDNANIKVPNHVFTMTRVANIVRRRQELSKAGILKATNPEVLRRREHRRRYEESEDK